MRASLNMKSLGPPGRRRLVDPLRDRSRRRNQAQPADQSDSSAVGAPSAPGVYVGDAQVVQAEHRRLPSHRVLQTLASAFPEGTRRALLHEMAEGAKVNRKQSLTMSVEEEISPTLGRPMHPLMDDYRADWERETPAIVHVGAASAAPDLKSDPPIRNLLRSKNGLDNGGHFNRNLGPTRQLTRAR